jgi:RecA/RadA recombinase
MKCSCYLLIEACAWVQQTRQKLNTFGGMPSEITSGGNALKFYASVRLNIKRKSQLKHGDEVQFWIRMDIVQVLIPLFWVYLKS